MKISRIETTLINVPFVAPIRWSGGANEDWTRIIVRMWTDDGLMGLGETLGGSVTKTLIDTEIAPMFMGESRSTSRRCWRKRPSCRSISASAVIVRSLHSRSLAGI